MKQEKKSLNVFFLLMINLATILSIKNWPITAELGLSSIFYLLFGALIFFVPVSLVAAELASGWPKQGGIFVWVKEALGHKWGFLAVWLLWLENIVWYPTILSFIAGTLAYVIDPLLADNNLYAFGVIAFVFWGLTLLNLTGIKTTGWISTVGMICGTLFPGILIIVLGFFWYQGGRPIHLEISWNNLFPDISHPTQMALLAGVLLGYGGMEMPAVHAKDVQNPQKNYPKAIFLSATIIVVLSILGTLAIAFVVPQKEISLISGGIEAIAVFFRFYGLSFLTPVIAILVAIGALGGVSTWIAGPCRGLLAAAEIGDLPQVLHKTNRANMPHVMMILQAAIVTLLSLVFLVFPDVSSSFWILIALASQLYLIMYSLMFISAIVLRYKRASTQRPYRIPGGLSGMWVVAGLGLIACLFSFVLGFFPPVQVGISSLIFFESFLVMGILIFCAAPLVILRLTKDP